MVATFELFLDISSKNDTGRIEAHRLFDAHLQVRHLFSVFQGDVSFIVIAKNLVQFFVDQFLETVIG